PTLPFTQRVVTDPRTTRRRMDDPILACVDRDVIDVRAVVREEQQVARTQRAHSRGDLPADTRHLLGRTRQPDTFSTKDVLHEARSVKSRFRPRALRSIANGEKVVCGVDY